MSHSNSKFLTPNKRISHLGSAKSGTHHFWLQRVTAIANVVLTIGLVCIVLSIVGKPYGEVIMVLKQPFAAITLALFVFSVTTHMKLGMQVIIEDYVSCACMKTGLLIGNIFFCFGVAIASLFAILKISLGG